MGGLNLAGQLLLFSGLLAAISTVVQCSCKPASLRAVAISLSRQQDTQTGKITPPNLWARAYLILAAIGFGCFSYGGVWFGLSWISTSIGSVSDGQYTSLRQSFAGIGALIGAIALTHGVMTFAEYHLAYLDRARRLVP